MPGGATVARGGLTIEAGDPMRMVEELGQGEREAIAAGDWSLLEEILERQKSLWQQLTARAGGDLATAPPEIAEALEMLYRIRRQHHALIERSFAEVRRQLAAAQTGSGAKAAYREAAGRAA